MHTHTTGSSAGPWAPRQGNPTPPPPSELLEASTLSAAFLNLQPCRTSQGLGSPHLPPLQVSCAQSSLSLQAYLDRGVQSQDPDWMRL